MKFKVKNIMLFTVLSIVCNTGITQEINFTNERLVYLKLINQAELSITDNNFETAINYYDSAFNLSEKARMKDIYNKAVCLRKIGKIGVADSLFNSLISKGYGSLNCIDTVNNSIPTVQQTVINGHNLNEIFERIFNDDQRVNSSRFADMEKYAHKVIEHIKYIKELSGECENLLYHDKGGKLFFPILHFFQLKGIAEKIKSDSTFRKQWIIYQCIENIDFNEIQFEDFLIKEVAKGNFDNESFASIMSVNGIWLGKPVSQYDDYIIVRYPNIICNEELQHINKNRKMFGLENYEDLFKKVWYADSLLTKGNPFKAFSQEEYMELIIDFENLCNFRIAKDYRMMMEFTKPEDAKKMYDRGLERLCPK
ncbi:MAG: hypothetical protein ACLFNU_07215 [Bacteroidales bacterium]